MPIRAEHPLRKKATGRFFCCTAKHSLDLMPKRHVEVVGESDAEPSTPTPERSKKQRAAFFVAPQNTHLTSKKAR
jgi:hypothetical protein